MNTTPKITVTDSPAPPRGMIAADVVLLACVPALSAVDHPDAALAVLAVWALLNLAAAALIVRNMRANARRRRIAAEVQAVADRRNDDR